MAPESKQQIATATQGSPGISAQYSTQGIQAKEANQADKGTPAVLNNVQEGSGSGSGDSSGSGESPQGIEVFLFLFFLFHSFANIWT